MRIDSIKLRKPIDEVLKGYIEPYRFQVGILKDGAHYGAQWKSKKKKNVLKTYAGGPARKQTRTPDGTLSSVGADVRATTGVNYLTKPFQKKTDDAVKMMRGFFGLAFGSGKLSKKKRLENLIQAVVRNPILRRAYGRNKKVTRELKGFDRKFIDTAQFFKGITARVRITLKKAG